MVTGFGKENLIWLRVSNPFKYHEMTWEVALSWRRSYASLKMASKMAVQVLDSPYLSREIFPSVKQFWAGIVVVDIETGLYQPRWLQQSFGSSLG
ncbi:MAG: hypothetical protein M1374_05230 [Firmicutes bacterium]|nr:hypothetical protein [Bacillota bacterium]